MNLTEFLNLLYSIGEENTGLIEQEILLYILVMNLTTNP